MRMDLFPTLGQKLLIRNSRTIVESQRFQDQDQLVKQIKCQCINDFQTFLLAKSHFIDQSRQIINQMMTE